MDPVAASAVRMSSGLAAHAVLLFSGWRVVQATQSPRWKDLGFTFASAALGMTLGMTLILKALQHGSAGMVGMLSSVTPVMLLPLLWWVYRRRPALGGWCGALADGGRLRADTAAPLRRSRPSAGQRGLDGGRDLAHVGLAGQFGFHRAHDLAHVAGAAGA